MLEEEELSIQEQLAQPGLEGFNASNGWLESFKKTNEIHKYRISGEGEDDPLVAVKAL